MNYRASNYCCNAELYDLVEYNAILILTLTLTVTLTQKQPAKLP